MSADSSPPRPLLLIPGPVEYSTPVRAILSAPTLSHVSPVFIKEFQSALKSLRIVLGLAEADQPFILSGSGTLGWDFIASNCLERGQKVLVLNTGYFSDSFADCLTSYGIEAVQLRAEQIGGTVSLDAIVSALQRNSDIRMVTITQVDTSTGVLNDVAAISAAVRSVRPEILIAVDGVCSIAGERFDFTEMQVDAVLSCSQKALGAPPGLAIVALGSRALKAFESRSTPVPGYYLNAKNWIPIMRAYESGSPSYFATPNVNLIRAFNVSLQEILAQGMEKRVRLHEWRSKAFKAAIQAMGLQQIPLSPASAANTLSAIYFPEGVDGPKFLNEMKENGIIIAGGLLKEIKTKYFRVGHLGSVSIMENENHIERAVEAIEKSLIACGAKIAEPGKSVKIFKEFPSKL